MNPFKVGDVVEMVNVSRADINVGLGIGSRGTAAYVSGSVVLVTFPGAQRSGRSTEPLVEWPVFVRQICRLDDSRTPHEDD